MSPPRNYFFKLYFPPTYSQWLFHLLVSWCHSQTNTIKPAPLFTLLSCIFKVCVSVRVYHFVYKHVPVSLILKPESLGQNHLTHSSRHVTFLLSNIHCFLIINQTGLSLPSRASVEFSNLLFFSDLAAFHPLAKLNQLLFSRYNIHENTFNSENKKSKTDVNMQKTNKNCFLNKICRGG